MAGAPLGWMCNLGRLSNLRDLAFTWGEQMGYSTTATIEEGIFFIKGYEYYFCGPFPCMRLVPDLPPLTILHLRNVYTDICVKILLSCPHLIEYHCYTPMSPPMNIITGPQSSNLEDPLQGPVTLKEPFILPNLKRFGWESPEGDLCQWSIALLENIRLPNLEELQWSGFPELEATAEEVDAIFRFFSNLPRTLHSFAYYNYGLALSDDDDYDDLEEEEEERYHCRILSHFPHVQSLVFRKCLASFVIAIVNLLIPSGRILDLTPDNTILLPSLDKIAVRSYQEGEEDGIGEALIEMLEERRLLLEVSEFTFEAVDCVVRWSRDTASREESADGFSVTVEGKVDSYFSNGTELDLVVDYK
jgi:hypothetical protein